MGCGGSKEEAAVGPEESSESRRSTIAIEVGDKIRRSILERHAARIS